MTLVSEARSYMLLSGSTAGLDADHVVPIALGEQYRVAPPDDQGCAGVGSPADAVLDRRIEGTCSERRRTGALQGQEQQPYDHTPGIRRPHAKQPPSGPIRCCLITYP